MSYADFLARKTQLDDDQGFAPVFMPPFLFDFQSSLVDWAAVLRLPGESLGADRETDLAYKLGMPVFNAISELENWRATLDSEVLA